MRIISYSRYIWTLSFFKTLFIMLRNVLLLTFCAFVLSRCVPDSICSDGDACTGTLKQPDLCGQDICNPGAPVCPVFVKSTPSISGEEKGSLEVTNNEKWVYLIWNSESEFRVKNAYLYVSRDPLQTDDPSKFLITDNLLPKSAAINATGNATAGKLMGKLMDKAQKFGRIISLKGISGDV